MDMDGTNILWFIGVPLATAVLGIAIVYGILRSRKRTVGDKIATEVGTRKLYEREDAEQGGR